jgi:hypothetical protein
MTPTRWQQLDSELGLRLVQAATAGLFVVFGLALILTLAYQGLALGHRFPLDYGESPLVDQAVRLAAGENIYRPDLSQPPYTISNYPPLYVAALAPWVSLFGPSFFPGRLLSVLCAWIVAGCLALIVYTHSRDRPAAALTAGVFVTLAYVTHWSAFLRVDMLALALSLAALALLARWPAARWSLVAAGVLLVAAIYTRQSYALAAPLAAVVWLWAGPGPGPLQRSWRRALGLAVLVGGAALAIFVLLQAVTAGGFFFNIVTANVNAYRRDILQRSLDGLVSTAWPLLLLGLASLALVRRRNPLYALAAPYLLGGALSALTIGKVGSNVNYLLELCAGLSLAGGLVLVWARQRVHSHALAALVLVLLALQAAYSMRTIIDQYASSLGERRTQTADLYRLEALVRDAAGPVLADEYMGLSTLQGRPIYLQPFETTQLASAGVWDQTPLLDSLQQQAFDLVLIYDRPWYTERWTPEMLAAIESDYRLADRLADVRVYRPFNRSTLVAAETCPGAPWRLPTAAARGLQADQDGLQFFGQGNDGTVPVVAVASGTLTRPLGWLDTVAIEHDDPLRPGETVWTFYAGMASANGLASHIVPSFPPGSAGVPVEAGEVLGYQGTWSGRKNWPAWLHVRFAMLPGSAPGVIPESLAGEALLDPASYLGLAPAATAPGANVQPLRCAPPP